MPYVVNPSLCIGCGKCVKACPSKAIVLVDKKAVINHGLCTCCGECASSCPKGAISWVPGRVLWGRGRGRRRRRRAL